MQAIPEGPHAELFKGDAEQRLCATHPMAANKCTLSACSRGGAQAILDVKVEPQFTNPEISCTWQRTLVL